MKRIRIIKNTCLRAIPDKTKMNNCYLLEMLDFCRCGKKNAYICMRPCNWLHRQTDIVATDNYFMPIRISLAPAWLLG